MEKIEIENVGLARSFSPRFFDVEISKLQNCFEKLEKVSMIMPSFPRKRFLILKNSRKGAIENEAAALQTIDDAFSTIYSLGNKIAYLLRNRMGGLQPEGGFKPLDPVVLQGKPFYLPYESHNLDSAGVLAGRSVAEGLTLICSICYLSSIYFVNSSITSILGRERRIADKLSGLTASLQRIMSPGGFQFIRNKYDLA